MKSYHFNFGDTKDNPLGFCARVRANSKAEAVEILQAEIDAFEWVEAHDDDIREDGRGIEYLTLYFNTVEVKEKDIDEWEHVENGE